jgi:nicotinamidase-related amidase
MFNPLLVVDVQCGFINDFTHHIPQRVLRLIQQGNHEPIVFTRFLNQPDGPYSQLLGWHECDRAPATDLAPELKEIADPELVFAKPGLCGLSDSLIQFLEDHQFKQVTVVGIDTDMCVLKIAMDLFDRGIEPIVLTDCCASTAGLQAHLAGLAVLSRNIGAQRLQEVGLGEGMLAAPQR